MNFKKRKKFNTLYFTILTDDAEKVAKRFKLSKLIVYLLTVLTIIPVLLLFYFVQLSNDQKQENEQLTAQLYVQSSDLTALENKLGNLEQDRTEVQAKLEQLTILETEMRQYISSLPEEVKQSGGINIDLTDLDLESYDNMESLSAELITRYEETISELEVTNKTIKQIPTISPVTSDKISSTFGVRSDPINGSSSYHTGLDIAANTGEPVYASADGTVVLAEYYGGYGNTVIISHGNGYKTLYGHLSVIKVEQGQSVKKGHTIALVGSTGRSTGPHLHYEILKNNTPVNPNTYIHYFENN